MLKRLYSKRIEQSMTELLKTAQIAQTIQHSFIVFYTPCIDCIHHLVIKAECGLGMPEGKASGGVWAKDCAYFWEKKI